MSISNSEQANGRKTCKFPHVLVLAIVLLAGGCINIHHEFTLNNDGSGTMKVLLRTEKERFESEAFGTVIEDIAYIFDEITYLESFSLIRDREYDAGEMHIWEWDYAFDDIRKLGNENYQITFESDGGKMTLKIKIAIVNKSNPGLSKEDLASEEIKDFLSNLSRYRYKLQVNVPGMIRSAPKAEVDGQAAYWEMSLDQILNPKKKTAMLMVVY